MPALLEVENLRAQFDTAAGTVRAVDGIFSSVDEGEPVGIVGESGCAKSASALSILRLKATGHDESSWSHKRRRDIAYKMTP